MFSGTEFAVILQELLRVRMYHLQSASNPDFNYCKEGCIVIAHAQTSAVIQIGPAGSISFSHSILY